MITAIRRQSIAFAATLLFFLTSSAQETRTFNQNASRSNHTRLSFSFSPVYSTPANTSKDSLLFRGSGAGLRFGADYFFGIAGIGISSGFGSSSVDDASINRFLKNTSVPQDQLAITKAKQQNMYLLLGPTLQFGNKVQLYAHAKAGFFMNNGGLVSVQQRGAQKAVYRNEPTDKSIYPGFQTGVSFLYKVKSDLWSFGIGVDYMRTKTEVMNYDARRGGGIEGLKLSQNISDIVAGITVRYNIFSPRDQSTGQSTGKRVLPTVNKREIVSPRDAASGLPTGKRKTYQPGQPVYGNITRQEEEMGDESRGPVTKTLTHPDGTTEEMTFSCPKDAAAYEQRTAEATDRAMWSSSIPANTISNADGITGIISGRLTWPSTSNTGIVTNAIISSTSIRGGSTTLNSQNSSTRTTPNSSFGTLVRLSARDAGSGMATGKRSSRDAASGLATGRRQYEPVFVEGNGSVCNPCMVTVKDNPLYKDQGTSGTNPMSNSRIAVGDEDCDGLADIDVSLIDRSTGSVVAKTRTEQCGDFFFANVPKGNYMVRVSGYFLSKKGYDTHLTSKTDLLGSVEVANQSVQLLINTDNGDGAMQQKAGISTSRSNIRTKSLAIIEADVDGDGEYESLRAIATFSDGSSRDETFAARVSNAAGSKSIVIEGDALQMSRRRVEVLKSNKQGDPNASRISSITIKNTGGRFTATGTFSDGTSRDITENMEVNTDHSGIKQYSFTINDTDDDGIADAVVKTKTKSNQSNDRVAAGDVDGDGTWSPRSNVKLLRVAAGDVDGDGMADLSVGAPFVPGGSVISAAMRPGSPIGGIIVKGGKNPGGSLRTIQTNENGEFEFTGLDAGDYTFAVEQKVFIEDETPVTVAGHGSGNSTILDSRYDGSVVNESDVRNGITLRWTPLVPKPKEPVTYRLRVWQLMQGQNGTQAMRSNKPIVEKSVIDVTETTVQGILTGPCKPPYLCDFIWNAQAISSDGKLMSSGNDGQTGSFSVAQPDNDGGAITKVQDHNSSRSNKSAVLDSRYDGSIINESDAKSVITLRWTPLVPKPKEPVTYRLRVWQLMQGQNGTQAMRSNKPVVEKSVTDVTETSIQGILTGPCKPPYLCDFIWSAQAISGGKLISNGNDNAARSFSVAQPDNDESAVTKAQDHNSSRSNKTASTISTDPNPNDETNAKTKDNMPIKWAAPESTRRTINTTRDNIKRMLVSLDDLEEQLDGDMTNARSIINTSRSNIKSQRMAAYDLRETLTNIEYTEKAQAMNELNQQMTDMNGQLTELLEVLKQMGSQYSSISNVLKTRHDTVKNSIGNIR